MDGIPPFHVCQFLTAENETVKGKYEKLKKKYKELYREMIALREKLMRIEIEKQYSTLMNSKPMVFKENVQEKKSNAKFEEKDVTKKLLPMYESLMKRYDVETKRNRNQAKQLKRVEAKHEQLQDELFSSNQKVDMLQKQLKNKEELLQTTSSASHNLKKFQQVYDARISSLTKEKKNLIKQNEQMQDELNGLDKSFFEEIEDMKYALQQSTRLNATYERVLKCLCKQYGLNYERTLETQQHSTPVAYTGKKKKKKAKTHV